MPLHVTIVATTIIKKFSILTAAAVFMLGFNILMLSPAAMADAAHSDHSSDCAAPCQPTTILKDEENLPEVEKDIVPGPALQATASDSYSSLTSRPYDTNGFNYNAENKVPMYIRIGLMRL